MLCLWGYEKKKKKAIVNNVVCCLMNKELCGFVCVCVCV